MQAEVCSILGFGRGARGFWVSDVLNKPGS